VGRERATKRRWRRDPVRIVILAGFALAFAATLSVVAWRAVVGQVSTAELAAPHTVECRFCAR
jgi:hypothetical protein